MTTKKPLVLYSGEIEEIRSGDNVTTDANSYTAVADGTLLEYKAVYASGAGSVSYADFAAATTGPAIGISGSEITDTNEGAIIISGVLTMSGLVTGSSYYVGELGSLITSGDLPSGTGSYVQKVGIALSTTQLKVDFEDFTVLNA